MYKHLEHQNGVQFLERGVSIWSIYLDSKTNIDMVCPFWTVLLLIKYDANTDFIFLLYVLLIAVDSAVAMLARSYPYALKCTCFPELHEFHNDKIIRVRPKNEHFIEMFRKKV